MPELPEVETVVRLLNRELSGVTIADIEIRLPRLIKGSIANFKATFIGHTLTQVGRTGKFILLHFDHGWTMVSHLRMEGKYKIHPHEVVPSRYAHILFYLKDGRRVDYEDVRQFGTFEWIETSRLSSLKSLSKLGIEPSQIDDISSIHRAFKQSRRPIKSLLLDQRILLGLGNIYADETLFASRIHPLVEGRHLTLLQTTSIIHHAQAILAKAIADGGTRIRSYSSGEPIDGQFALRIQVYNRQGKPCLSCGHRLAKITVSGRGTHYCPSCQHTPGMPYIIGVTGTMASGKSTFLDVAKACHLPTYRADDIVHELYQKRAILRELQALTHVPIVKDNHLLNEPFLTTFLNDATFRRHVETRIHPRVLTMLKTKVRRHRGVVVVEIPLLFQAHADAWMDTIVSVHVARDLQRLRLMNRHPNRVDQLLQLSELNQWHQYAAFIDVAMENNESLDTFKDHVQQYLKKVIKQLPAQYKVDVQTLKACE